MTTRNHPPSSVNGASPGRTPGRKRANPEQTWPRLMIVTAMIFSVMTAGQPWIVFHWLYSGVVRGDSGSASPDPAPEQLFCRSVTRQIAVSPTQTTPLEITFDFRHSRLRLRTTVPAERYTVDFLQSGSNPDCDSRLTGSGMPPETWIDLAPCRPLVSSKGVIVSYRTSHDEAIVHIPPPPVVRIDQLAVRVPSTGHERREVLRPGRHFRVDYEFLMPVPTLVRVNDSYPAKAPELRLQCYNPVSKTEIFVPVTPGTMQGHFFLPLDPTEQNHNDWETPSGTGREASRVQRRQETLRHQIRNWEIGWDVQSLAPAVIRDGSISNEAWQQVFLPPPHGSAGTHPDVPGRGAIVKAATTQGECLFDTSSVSQLHLASHISVDGWFPEDVPPAGAPVGGGPTLSLENGDDGVKVVVRNGKPWDMFIIRNKGYIVSSRPVAATEYQETGGAWHIPLRNLWFAGVSEGEEVEIAIVREPGVGHTITVPFASLPPQATIKPAWYEVLSDMTGGGGASDESGTGTAPRLHFAWPRGWARGDQAEAMVDERAAATLESTGDPVWVKARIRLRGLAGSHPEWHGVSMIPWLPPDRERPEEATPPDTWQLRTDRKEYADLEPLALDVWIPPHGHPAKDVLPDGQVQFYLTTGSVLQHNIRSFGQDETGVPAVIRHPAEHHPLPIVEMPVGHYQLQGRPGTWNRYVLPPAVLSRPYHLRSKFYDIYQTKTQMNFGRQIVILYLHRKDNWQELTERWAQRREESLATGKVICADTDMILRGTPHLWTDDEAARRDFGSAVESFPYPRVRPPMLYHPYGEGFLNPVAMHVPPPFRMVIDRFRCHEGIFETSGTHFDLTAGPCRGMFYPTGEIHRKNIRDHLFLAADELEYPSGEEGKRGIALRNPSRDITGSTSGVEEPGHEAVVIAGAPVFPIMDPALTSGCAEFTSPPVVDKLSVPAFSKSQVTVTVEAGKFSYGVIEAGGKPTFIFRSGRYEVEIPEGTNRVTVQVSLYSVGCTIQATQVLIERERPPAQQWAIGAPQNFPADAQKESNVWQGNTYQDGRRKLSAMGLDYQKKKPDLAAYDQERRQRGVLMLSEPPGTSRRDSNW